MTTITPQFQPGDRVFSHYTMQWGTVAVSTSALAGQGTWYRVNWDDGGMDEMNDGNGNWDMARIIPPNVASRYGYGTDPKE